MLKPNNAGPSITTRTKQTLARASFALLGLTMAGCIGSAAADAPRGASAPSVQRLAARVAALEAAQVTEHKRRDFVIWQNRSAIRRIIDATASPAKPATPDLGPAALPSLTKDRACCMPPSSFLVCDDVHPIDCKKKGGTLAPGQSASTPVTCGVGVCGIKPADQSASGWNELFGSGEPRPPTPRGR